MYAQEVRDAVRGAYVFQRQPLNVAARAGGVTEPTARRWKRAAAAAGDDWDRARAAGRIAAGGLGDLTARVIEDFALLFESTIADLKAATDLGPEVVAETLARLADSYTKVVKAAGAVDPKLGRLSIALQVLDELAKFIQAEFPDDLARFSAILEPFGQRLPAVLAA